MQDPAKTWAVINTLLLVMGWECVQGQYTTAVYWVSGVSDSIGSANITGANWAGITVVGANVTAATDTNVSAQGCAAGTWALSDSYTCTACGAGKYSGNALAISEAACIPCDPGWWSSAVGATSISTCQACGLNTYSNVSAGASVATCQPCPQYSSSYSASNSITACVCNPGYSGPNGKQPLLLGWVYCIGLLIKFWVQGGLAACATLANGV
jgi:hypothetical protein